MTRTALSTSDLPAAEMKDLGGVSARLAAQFVGIIGNPSDHVAQFMQEGGHLRCERVSSVRAHLQEAPAGRVR